MENNWEQVKDIFQAVIERPEKEREQFLSEACRGNQSLSDEVRGLLDSFEENDSFFDQGAMGEVADIIVGNSAKLEAGTKLGRYKIKSALGAGGMGEVFLAEDTELERLVALKILSPAFSNDTDRSRRFVREAKSVSALNHPNILTIHEIGQSGDLHFIATEYVKGETLRQRQQRKVLSLREILDITIQIAVALSAAHNAKIVHRDIKPENIMIREDGLIKVLDFGLAKLIEQNQNKIDSMFNVAGHVHTAPGLIMGTAAYMSPEQTRGKETDARTDIWSLGVCLYEMIAGVKPFAGETISDTIAAIIKSDPPPLPANTPKKLNDIILKALQKNVEDRYQNIKDLLSELKNLRSDFSAKTEFLSNPQIFDKFGGDNISIVSDFSMVQSTAANQLYTAPNSVAEKQTKGNFKAKWIISAAAVILLAFGVSFYYIASSYRQNSTFETMRFSRLTYTGDAVGELIAISPDGKYTAFVRQETGNQSLWVKHIATSGTVQVVSPAKVAYGGITFSSDNNQVYYTVMDEKGATALHRVPILGGDSWKLIDNVERPVSFSTDGAKIAFVQNETTLMTANIDGTEPKLLANAPKGSRWNLTAWSPDDKTIAVTSFSSADNNTYLSEISVADGTEKPINSPPWLRISGIAWLSDKSGLIISGRDLETKLSQIWAVNYPDGKTNKITNDLNSYLGLSLSADGKSIASVQYERVSNVWTASEPDLGVARQITFDKDKDEGMSGVALAPDGKVVYTTRITGVQDLWIANADGSEKRQLTNNVRSNFSPAVSPDNRYIAFISDRSGNASVWRMDLDGGNPKQLTEKKGIAALPGFSPDGNWIIYQFTDPDNKPTVWKININGGEPIQLTEVFATKPVFSPDGNFFACYYGEPTGQTKSKLAVIPVSGGQPTKLLDFPLMEKTPIFRWGKNGKELIYIDKSGQNNNFWSQSLGNNDPAKSLTDFKSEDIFRFDVLNGKIAFVRGHETSDVIMIENFR